MSGGPRPLHVPVDRGVLEHRCVHPSLLIGATNGSNAPRGAGQVKNHGRGSGADRLKIRVEIDSDPDAGAPAARHHPTRALHEHPRQ